MGKVFKSLRINKKLLVVLHDLIVVVIAWQLAWLSRFNFEIPFYNWQLSLSLIPVLLIIQAGFFWYFHLYRGLWRFASLRDLWNIFRAALVGGIVTAIIFFVLFRLEGVPRTVLILYPVFLIFILGGPRLGYRLWKDRNTSILSAVEKRRVLIIGAGNAGDMLVREMHRSNSDIPVAILDDDSKLKGAEIRGVKIFGSVAQVQEIVEKFNIDWIAIAIPSATRIETQRIVEVCEQTNLPIKILPNIREMKAEHDVISGLREVSIEDLLGREQVELDWANVKDGVRGKCVVVTGGGGSIGSVLASQIIELGPSMLLIVDHSEYNLYKIDQLLNSKNLQIDFKCLLGDVCDSAYLKNLFQQYEPQLVFHAAAYKHVPILQRQPHEALNNNILGTKTVLDVSCAAMVEKFVLISTDKAVNPSNILGVSKRIAELYTESMNYKCTTQCITVRFGNVLDSAGSVVPLFREQIRNGGPLTVTHPEITRYFMTILEASQLILQAATMGKGGEIFVLDMGEPVKIKYLAEQMIILSGKRLEDDIKISYCGLRPGEKLYEELFYSSEKQIRTSHQKIFLAKHSLVNAKNCIEKINSFIIENIDSHEIDLVDNMCDFLESCSNDKDNYESDNIIHLNN